MKEVWVVQTNENNYQVLDIFDNKEEAFRCAKYLDGWIEAVFPMQVKSTFILPNQ
jgi:hypothetical protein